MRHVTIYTTDKEFSHFVELAKNLHYVKKIETDEETSATGVVDNELPVMARAVNCFFIRINLSSLL